MRPTWCANPNRLRLDVDRNNGDELRLTVPATSAAVRIARVGAAGLGTRLGFTFTEVEELRLAVGEAAAQLCGAQTEASLVVVYTVEDRGLRVTLALDPGADQPPVVPAFSDLAAAVLDTVVDEWKLDREAARLELRKVPADHDD
jgi:anti-sigma regulatory factor (Ser/Thr protein kinase)